MPLYAFFYENADGETVSFDDFMSYDEMKGRLAAGTLTSPCGGFVARREFTAPSIGAEGATNAERAAFVGGKKSLSERRELSRHVRNARDERVRSADPADAIAKSGALWTGKEDASGIVSRKAATPSSTK